MDWPGYGIPYNCGDYREVIESGAFGPNVAEDLVRREVFTPGGGGMVVHREEWDGSGEKLLRRIQEATLHVPERCEHCGEAIPNPFSGECPNGCYAERGS